MDAKFEYNLFHLAKLKLTEELVKVTRNIKVREVVDDWFKQNVIELGLEYTVSVDAIKEMGDERVKEMVRRNSMMKLADDIFEQGLYSEQKSNALSYERKFLYRVLIFGSHNYPMVGKTKEKK